MEITEQDIKPYLDQLDDARKKDIEVLVELAKKVTNKKPKMWGTIIGFGHLHYQYPTKRSGEMPLIGIASRKEAITLYLSYEINKFETLKQIGKYKAGQGCLYIKKLSDIDLTQLEQLMIEAKNDLLSQKIITVLD